MYVFIYQNLYMNVHHQIIHDSQKVELTQMWIKWQIKSDKFMQWILFVEEKK